MMTLTQSFTMLNSTLGRVEVIVGRLVGTSNELVQSRDKHLCVWLQTYSSKILYMTLFLRHQSRSQCEVRYGCLLIYLNIEWRLFEANCYTLAYP